jgi:hypothetical protein
MGGTATDGGGGSRAGTGGGGSPDAAGGSGGGGAPGSGGGSEGGSGPQPDAELCAMPDMQTLYPGSFPPNPYGDLFDADSCVAQPHDVIMVLGCPNDDTGAPSSCQTQRADTAVGLRDDGYGDEFIVSGAAVHNQWVEAQTLHDLLIERGVPDDHIFLDVLAEHTDENIYYSTQIMLQHGWKSALVVSDDPGHLVMTATCDSNCCVDLGRLTVVEMPPTGVAVGHYALYPEGQQVSQAECDSIEAPFKAMCINLSSRKACKDNFQL